MITGERATQGIQLELLDYVVIAIYLVVLMTKGSLSGIRIVV